MTTAGSGRGSCAHGPACGCDALVLPGPAVHNPPGQPTLAWRVSPHASALGRLRSALPVPLADDDPATALLDAWAVVADTVSFYTERIAQEGFLRTATELGSVRLLARAIGYELQPGVAAEVLLAFDVEDAPGAPGSAVVPEGTAVRSVPGQGELPQTFETGEVLDARAAWNAVPAASTQPQELRLHDPGVWLHGAGLGVAAGDSVLLVGSPDTPGTHGSGGRRAEPWVLRTVAAVAESPPGLPGWTHLALDPLGAVDDPSTTSPLVGPEVHLLARRTGLFGANAPDPALLSGTDAEGAAADGDWPGIDDPRPLDEQGDAVEAAVELDGDQSRVRVGTWLALENDQSRRLYCVLAVAPGGAARFALSGRLTRLHLDRDAGLGDFHRRTTLAHCESRSLPAAEKPSLDAVTGRDLVLAAPAEALSPGRRVVVTGFAPGTVPADPRAALATPPPLAEPAVVTACSVAGATMTVTLDRDLAAAYDPATLRVRANVVPGTHGESVRQVLGSGNARTTFQRLRTRRGPLTHVRSTSPSGARSTLEVRVDGVRWDAVDSLDLARPDDRVVTTRMREDGTAVVTAGDGVTGARLPTGSENVEASYRVGIGAAGALAGGQLTLLPQRPFGIRSVTNPAPASGWADPESMAQARTNAPLRTKTLDRAVSVPDHQDFAAAYAGVGLARADGVWDGRARVVVVSLLSAGGAPVGDDLLTALRGALGDARDPGTPLHLLPGELVSYGIRVDVATDPAYERTAVLGAVRDALGAGFGPGAQPFATAVTAARVLVAVRAVDGVLACTMPDLLPVVSAPGAPLVLGGDDTATPVVVARPGRWEGGGLLPAEEAALAAGGVELGVMAQ